MDFAHLIFKDYGVNGKVNLRVGGLKGNIVVAYFDEGIQLSPLLAHLFHYGGVIYLKGDPEAVEFALKPR